MRRSVRLAVALPIGLLGALLAAIALYLVAALVLGALPVNSGFRSAPDGIPVFIRTNGVHAEFVLPTHGPHGDWSADHPPSDMRALKEPLPWIAFGWGDRRFFASTPTWSDLRATTALIALSGTGEGAVHVEYVASPTAYRAAALQLTPAQHQRLVAYVRGSFVRDRQGRPQRLPEPGYFDADAFYAAVPAYSAFTTCNDWVRRGLAESGVRAPRWAPFDFTLFWHLPQAPSR